MASKLDIEEAADAATDSDTLYDSAMAKVLAECGGMQSQPFGFDPSQLVALFLKWLKDAIAGCGLQKTHSHLSRWTPRARVALWGYILDSQEYGTCPCQPHEAIAVAKRLGAKLDQAELGALNS